MPDPAVTEIGDEELVTQFGHVSQTAASISAGAWWKDLRSEILHRLTEGRRAAACLEAAKAELQNRADWLSEDHPGYDGTDAAHPAWWRGEKAGSAGTAEALLRVAEGGGHGTFGGAEVQRAAEAIHAIRLALAAYEESDVGALRREVARLREALRPFADIRIAAMEDATHAVVSFPRTDFARARAAVQPEKEKTNAR